MKPDKNQITMSAMMIAAVLLSKGNIPNSVLAAKSFDLAEAMFLEAEKRYPEEEE